MTATNIIPFPIDTKPERKVYNITTTNKAKLIRAEFKKLGWNSRHISVKCDIYSMGGSIDITIKNSAVDDIKVEKIASFEYISRCEHTGEILSGGNTYISVDTTDAVDKERSDPYLEASRLALVEANQKQNKICYIGDTGVKLVRYSDRDIDVNNRSLYNPLTQDGSRIVANAVYKYLQKNKNV